MLTTLVPGWRTMREPTRAFTAIALDDDARASLARCQDELRTLDCDVRWVAEEAFHVTLHFLGVIDLARLPEYERVMRDAVAECPAFDFRVEGLGCFPNRRKPRVLWAGITIGADAVELVHRRLSAALQVLGYEPDRKGFHPHVTIGRVKGARGLAPLRERLVRMRGPDASEQRASGVRLERSRLTRGGAIYDTLLEIPLQGPPNGSG